MLARSILDAINEASAGAKVAAAVFGTGTERKGRSIAIYVYPDSTPPNKSPTGLARSPSLSSPCVWHASALCVNAASRRPRP